MKEVLSQSEIDLLLNALAAGEITTEDVQRDVKANVVKTYDFRRPNKFSKDQLRTLYMIHDNFARLVSNFLSGYLRTNVTVKIASVDQLTYEDFVVSIPSPTLLVAFTMEPLKGTAVFECNPAFSFPIIDLLFGGPGEMPHRLREMTDIELSVLKKLSSKLLDNLVFAWSDIFSFKHSIENIETNPQFNQIISPNETVAIVTLATTVNHTQGIINICLPYITLETVISKLTAHYWFSSQEKSGVEEAKSIILRKLVKVPIEVTAVIGHAELTVREFLQLAEGDVIPLDVKIGDDIELLVNDQLKFWGQPGLVKDKAGIQVTSKVFGGE
ncbi:MAG: flagellar motor switch protein FliM [Bacillota bacterium]